jgi:shikimate kinase
MACGKSSVAKEIAKNSPFKFIDLDTVISDREDMPISDIFKYKGEIYFRKKESLYLNELLDQNNKIILSVGGGTPCYGNNMALINKKATSVFINTPLNILVKRLLLEKASRPLVADLSEDDLKEFVAKHLFERLVFYEKAQHVLNTSDKDVSVISSEILKLIGLN